MLAETFLIYSALHTQISLDFDMVVLYVCIVHFSKSFIMYFLLVKSCVLVIPFH